MPGVRRLRVLQAEAARSLASTGPVSCSSCLGKLGPACSAGPPLSPLLCRQTRSTASLLAIAGADSVGAGAPTAVVVDQVAGSVERQRHSRGQRVACAPVGVVEGEDWKKS